MFQVLIVYYREAIQGNLNSFRPVLSPEIFPIPNLSRYYFTEVCIEVLYLSISRDSDMVTESLPAAPQYFTPPYHKGKFRRNARCIKE